MTGTRRQPCHVLFFLHLYRTSLEGPHTMGGMINNSTSSAATSPASSPASHPPVLSPCAACKILRRRCAEKCVLAPYFPPAEPNKFAIAHRVFGASNIIKLLQELPDDQRADAVNSLVYEAEARLRDPVYGCTGAICQLQKQVSELQAELAKAQAEIFNIQWKNSSLFELLCKQHDLDSLAPSLPVPDDLFIDDSIFDLSWEPLWT